MDRYLKNFYKNKRVLITGHTGFKGGWLALWLSSLGADVAGYALEPTTDPNFYKILNLKRRILSQMGDVRNLKKLNLFFKNFKPEMVIHMAAQALVRPSYEDPVGTYETNVMGTVNVLEMCRTSSSVRSIVVVTSDKCYENREQNKAYREEDPMGGYDPYSSSKGCAELVTAAYLRSFFSPEKYRKEHKVGLASARAGNVIGGGDWNKDRLVPDCVRAFLKNENVVIRYPYAIRPWQHVLEPLYGYLLLSKKLYEQGPRFSGAWNFGPEQKNEKPVKWVVEKMYALWEGGCSWTLSGEKQPHEAHYLRLNSLKAKTLLGWRPKMDLSSALKETIGWYKAWQNNLDMNEYSLNQIEKYMRG